MRKIAFALPLIGAAIKRGESTTRFIEYELTPAGKALRMAQARKKRDSTAESRVKQDRRKAIKREEEKRLADEAEAVLESERQARAARAEEQAAAEAAGAR